MQALDETKEIIAIRGIESSIRFSLDKIAKVVRASIKLKPSTQMEQMQGDDVMVLVHLRDVLGSVTQLTMAGKRTESLQTLQNYLKNDYLEYYLKAKKRVEAEEQSASLTVYTIGLVTLKLASAMMPQTAEDIYQKYYRFYEVEPSVHIVPWPEALIKLMA
jgi:isoleucyl-tRNA synthetase